jgi:hypothetical protein
VFPETPLSRCEGHWATKRCIQQYLRSLKTSNWTVRDATIEEGMDLESPEVQAELEAA